VGGSWGRVFFILPDFISSAPSSCRYTLFDFLPFFLRIFLGESCGFPSPALTRRCPVSPCVRFRHLDLASSLRRNKYWMQSSCYVGTLSTPCLFHCSSIFVIFIPSLSTWSMSSESSVPTSFGVISSSAYASCMGVLSSLISPSIEVAQLPCSFLLFGRSVGSFGVCSLNSWDFSVSLSTSASLLVLSHPSGIIFLKKN